MGTLLVGMTMRPRKKSSTPKKPTKKAANEIDQRIGQRLKSFRIAAKMSQEELGKHLGVAFQQIQKYEKGENRLSGSRLFTAAEALRVTPAQLLGANGGGKADSDQFDALAEPAVNAMVREMKKLPTHQRRAAARAMTDLIEAFTLKR
jgi:transcriptional regulator with XRE-family HTH domain